ncbi:MAG: sodium:solute symporter [Candidatus Eisenbacteria bacterium]
MSPIDWGVLFAALAGFVAYGVWRGRGERDLTDFLLAGRSMRWYMVALSVMATQASAITFLSTPGQGYVDGLRFVQFYFGLPLAMVVLCVTAIPIYHRLKVFTAYEYLEKRFDAKTRSLAAGLFLVQRGLAAGLTIYAPALVLSVILGWDVRWTCVLLGGLVVIYTASGGSKAVSHTHVLQFLIIMSTMVVAFGLIVASLPAGVSPGDAAWVAGRTGKLNALQLRFDPNDRYNLWSGLIGGFFLQLSYFGTDQSQVGRYLTGRSIAESRLGLIFNGLVKVPMQLGILALGVLVFVFYQFAPPPLFFNPAVRAKLAEGPNASAYQTLETRHRAALDVRETHVRSLLAARRSGDTGALAREGEGLDAAERELADVRGETVALIKAQEPKAQTSDTNYVFLTFVLSYLPAGLIGLVFAAVFAASMNSTSAELNALTSTTVVDVYKRLAGTSADGRHDVWVSRLVTVGWAAFAVGFAEYAARLGSLIEVVNILGSLFYGTILGIFLTAFYLRWVGGTAVFIGAIVAEVAVIACFKLTGISFLWYNLIGCALVMVTALALQPLVRRGARPGGV